MTKSESLLFLIAFLAVRRLEQIASIQRAKFACLDAAIRASADAEDDAFPSFDEVALLMARHRELRT